ncbi:MAG: nucleotidyltransferase domain-containing protein [Gaiellaceae bacterium]
MNDLHFVLRAVDLLESNGVRTWVSGGWGEELRGLEPPRDHADLDLLYPARSWQRVDGLHLDWLEGKRLPWKRSFALEGTTVELFLVERDERGWFTQLARRRHDWPDDAFSANGRVAVASTAALTSYRGRRRHRRAA